MSLYSLCFDKNSQHHRRHLDDRKKIYNKLKQSIRAKELENAQLDRELEETSVCVAERKHINEVNGKCMGLNWLEEGEPKMTPSPFLVG